MLLLPSYRTSQPIKHDPREEPQRIQVENSCMIYHVTDTSAHGDTLSYEIRIFAEMTHIPIVAHISRLQYKFHNPVCLLFKVIVKG